MTEQPQTPTQTQPFNVDLSKILPAIANLYKQYSWALPLIERLAGFKIPADVLTALEALASGKPLTAEDMQKMQTSLEQMQPQVGEPVLTRSLAQTAWWLHYKEGMGTRQIAEQFTKDGNPCSHATIARWINAIDEEKRFSKIARLITVGKFLGFIGIVVLAFLIGYWFF